MMCKDPEILCGYECGQTASCNCQSCSIPFCDACFATIHSKGLFKTHSKISLSVPKDSTRCSIHNEELKIFCKTCMTPACLMCSSFGNHKGHECVLIDEYADSLLEKNEHYVKKLTERHSKVSN